MKRFKSADFSFGACTNLFLLLLLLFLNAQEISRTILVEPFRYWNRQQVWLVGSASCFFFINHSPPPTYPTANL